MYPLLIPVEEIIVNKNGSCTSLQVLNFIVQDAYISLNLQYVEKILPLMMIEKVPNCPAYLVGLLNLSGKSLPVVDLAIRLGMARQEPYSLDVPILLCSHGAHQAGFIVDNIIGLMNIETDELQLFDDFNKLHSLFSASIRLQNRLSLLLNMELLLPVELNQQAKTKEVSTECTLLTPELLNDDQKHDK